MSPPSPLSFDDYEAIAAAVMETDRGRWFLAEFARRNRAADTSAVLSALGELERRLLALGRTDAREQPPDAGAERTVALMRRVADRAALVRNELESGPPNRRIPRALRQLAHLDRLIGLALISAGAPGGDAEPHRRPDEDAAWDGEDAGPDPQSVAGDDQALDPADYPIVTPESVLEARRSPYDAVFASDGDPDLAEPAEAETGPPRGVGAPWSEPAPLAREAARPEQETPAVEPGRPKMPAARTPSLLESLSDEEKAILFA